jgi:putative ABC transport system permease protein
LRDLIRNPRVERELADELRFHIERQIEQNIAAGMSAEEARHAAVRLFGGAEQLKEECRDARGTRLMGDLVQDIRYALRMLRKNPGFTAVAVLTLALGIGVNTAIFSVVNAVLFHPFPYKDAERLALLCEQSEKRPFIALSVPDYYDWERENHTFESMGAVLRWTPTLTGSGEPEQLSAATVTAGIFKTLGMAPEIGRTFGPSEDRPGAQAVVVLSHKLWQRRFGSDPGIVGKGIALDGESYTVIGVMPPRFEFWTADLWGSMSRLTKEQRGRDFHPGIFAIGRLKTGVTFRGAENDLERIAAQLRQAYPETNRLLSAQVTSWIEQTGGDLRPALLILFGATGFVLLITAGNLASLLLARGIARQKEIAIRLALGAGRGRLLRQLLTESTLLAVLGGGLGLLLCFWAVRALTVLIPESSYTAEVRFGIDSRVLLFTLGVSLLTGMLFGLLPALRGTSGKVSERLREHVWGQRTGRIGRGLRQFLVAGELALAVVLLTGSTLLLQSFYHLRRLDRGFDSSNILTFSITLPRSQYQTSPQVTAFYQALLQRVESLSGVQSAGVASNIPAAGFWRSTQVTLPDRPAPEKLGDAPEFEYSIVTPGFFQALRIPLANGRYFSASDGPGTPTVIVINETARRRFWANENPIGRTLHLGPPENLVAGMIPPGFFFPTGRIVGVVGDVVTNSPRRNVEPQFYFALSQTAGLPRLYLAGQQYVIVRGNSSAAMMASVLRQEVWAVDKNQPVSPARTLDDRIASSLGESRMITSLLGLFAGLALVLSAVGVFGLMSYTVAQRTQEIGIRMALGAQRESVLRLIVGEGMRTTLLGVGIGLLTGVALMRVLADFLFGVTPKDPYPYAAAAILLSVVALAACYLPARRAMQVDPIVSLREQ